MKNIYSMIPPEKYSSYVIYMPLYMNMGAVYEITNLAYNSNVPDGYKRFEQVSIRIVYSVYIHITTNIYFSVIKISTCFTRTFIVRLFFPHALMDIFRSKANEIQGFEIFTGRS